VRAENLTLACRNAVLNMIELLQERGFTREQAYVICSVAVDLRVSSVVNVPTYCVSGPAAGSDLLRRLTSPIERRWQAPLDGLGNVDQIKDVGVGAGEQQHVAIRRLLVDALLRAPRSPAPGGRGS